MTMKRNTIHNVFSKFNLYVNWLKKKDEKTKLLCEKKMFFLIKIIPNYYFSFFFLYHSGWMILIQL